MVDVACVLDAKSRLGEGIVWDERRDALWWVDIEGCQLCRFHPGDGEFWRMDLPTRPGCMALREDGGMVMALQNGFHFVDVETREITRIVDPEADKPGNRFNDGTADPAGRLIAGTMPLGDRLPVAAFYQLNPDLSWRTLMDGFTVTNGTAFSPDGRIFYFSDSQAEIRTIWAADYDLDTGDLRDRRVFVDTHGLAGRPDGGCVDADGCYWMAGVGGWQLVRFTPKGEVDRVIALPVEKPTKLAFGGAKLDTIYVTSIRDGLDEDELARQPAAGGILALRVPGVQGLPGLRFGG